jgi:hypothetical protein
MSFFEKSPPRAAEPKKFYSPDRAAETDWGQRHQEQSFFASFCSQKEDSSPL